MTSRNTPKGPRLYLRRRAGRTLVYVIRDTGHPERSTGASDIQSAQRSLADYINAKPLDLLGPKEPHSISIGACLTHYEQTEVPQMIARDRAAYALARLRPFWSQQPVSYITKASCAAYSRWRATETFTTALGKPLPPPRGSTIAKELRTLRSALRCAYQDNQLTRVPHVALPGLQRKEPNIPSEADIQRAIAACDHEGIKRYLRLASQTGTRKDRILRLQWEPNLAGGWIDTDRGWLHRSRHGEIITNKRADACRLPPDLLDACRQWKQDGCVWVCHHTSGQRMSDVRKPLARAIEAAGIAPFTPHKLKHFAITKAIRAGADPVEAAAYFSTSIRTMQIHYFHHDPERQSSLADIMKLGEHR